MVLMELKVSVVQLVLLLISCSVFHLQASVKTVKRKILCVLRLKELTLLIKAEANFLFLDF